MKDGPNSNRLNGLLTILKLNNNRNLQKKKISYISHKLLKDYKSVSSNNIYKSTDLIKKKNTDDNLHLKIACFRKNINSSYDKMQGSWQGNNTFYKKKSILPYLYRNLQKKKNINKYFAVHHKKMNSTDFDKRLRINLSFKSMKNNNAKIDGYNNFDININKAIDYNQHLYRTKFQIKNPIKINKDKNSEMKKRYLVNQIDLGDYFKNNNSRLFPNDGEMFFNENYSILLNEKNFKKELDNKDFKRKIYSHENKTQDVVNNEKNSLNNSKKSLFNLTNKKFILMNENNIKLIQNDNEKAEKNNNIKLNNRIILKKQKIIKNDLNKVEINDENVKDNINLQEIGKDKIEPLLNIKEIEKEKDKNENNKEFFLDDEQEKLFNTNQKDFFKFRNDIIEEPDLEEEID